MRLRNSAAAQECRAEPAAAMSGGTAATGGAGGVSASGHPGASDDHLPDTFRRLGATEIRNEAGAFLLRRVSYPFPARHGWHNLQELWDVAPHLAPIAARQNGGRKSGRQPLEHSAPPAAPEAGGLLFLDTETTGLGVGAGNVPFMVGIGTCAPDAFVVEQCLIRHPGEERAMLMWLTERFSGVTHLVTYNGRAFDWPVLLGRFVLNGWRLSGNEPRHIDFLHPSRALWKHTLPTCRLSTVEEERLGIRREDDVPGAMAPELYMKFLRDGNAAHLDGVFIHNEKDILTLAALAVHFGKLLGGGAANRMPAPVRRLERLRTALWLEQHGQTKEAMRLYSLLAEEAEAADGEWGWRLELAARLKRLGMLEKAIALWHHAAALAEAARFPRIEAHIELAMYYEHKARNYEKALAMAESARMLILRKAGSFREMQGLRAQKEQIEKRILRIRQKLRKQESGQLF
jgi:hypothetical protein